MRLDETSTRVNRAVRAEAARMGIDGKTLAVKALRRDPKYVYERFRFEKPFSTRDLTTIANFLGITADDIWHSAQFDSEIHAQGLAS
jgi:lambda repressor-like predicted transcriptional regulator